MQQSNRSKNSVSQPKLYYVSMHGGEGWEEICEDPQEAIERIAKHWPKVPRKNLLWNIYIFPLESRVKNED